jgi:carboxymethylenebutenolidase
MLQHLAGKKSDNPKRTTNLTEYHYPGVETYKFATPFHASFHYTTEAHTRSLTHLKPRLDGPCFDLEVIWDEHCYYEFADRSVEHTMSTMVQEPYVNHVPTVSPINPYSIIYSVPNRIAAHRRRRS